MSETFLGFPLQAWGLLSLVAAVACFFNWPEPKSGRRGPPRSSVVHFILRWFHSVVWLLLALACFLWASGPSAAAAGLAIASLIVYVVFVVTLLRDRGRE